MSTAARLQIYLWNGATAWNLAFDEPVKSYKFAAPGEASVAGGDGRACCDKPKPSKTCHLTYRLNKDWIDLAR